MMWWEVNTGGPYYHVGMLPGYPDIFLDCREPRVVLENYTQTCTVVDGREDQRQGG